MSIYFKIIAIIIFWLLSVIGSYRFGWSNAANLMDSKHDISAKLLRLSIEERVQRESARRERAKLMMIGYSFFAIFLILIVIVDSVVR